MGPDRPKTAPLAATRVLLLPLTSCQKLRSAFVEDLEATLGVTTVASTYSGDDGSFQLYAPSGAYTFFADYEGRPKPLQSGSREGCNRVEIGDEDVALPSTKGGITDIEARR